GERSSVNALASLIVGIRPTRSSVTRRRNVASSHCGATLICSVCQYCSMNASILAARTEAAANRALLAAAGSGAGTKASSRKGKDIVLEYAPRRASILGRYGAAPHARGGKVGLWLRVYPNHR